MKKIILPLLASVLLIGDFSTSITGQAKESFRPTDTSRSLERKTTANRDTIANLLNEVKAVVNRKPTIKYRYIKVKPKITLRVDTVYLPFPEDSVKKIIEERVAQIETNGNDSGLVPRVGKRKSFLQRLFYK